MKMKKMNMVSAIAIIAIFASMLSPFITKTAAESNSVLNFKFCLTSDTHIPTGSTNLTKALQISVNEACKAIIFTGDLTNDATNEQYDSLMTIMNGNPHPPAYYVVGNHEFQDTTYTFPQMEQRFKQKTGAPSLYYDQWIEGYHFIFLGMEQNIGSDEAYLSDTQLSWFENKLAENADYDKPIFVFLHQPLQETVNGTYINDNYGLKGWPDGVRQWVQVKSILAKYPQVIFTSGHKHNPAHLFTSEATYVNAGPVKPSGGSTEQMMLFEVNNDKVDIKGINIPTNNVTWTGTVPTVLNVSSLQQNVTNANALLSGSDIGGGANQFPNWAADNLQQAITRLSTLLTIPSTPKADLGTALMDLRKAKTVFIKSRNAVTNIALHQSVSTSDGSNIDQAHTPQQAVDGGINFTNGWNSKSSSTSSAWFQIDLGAKSLIKRVEVDARPNSTYDGERKNFQIRASNDPTFASYDVLGSVGGTAFTSLTWGIDLTTATTYRYIRYQKMATDYVFLTEMRVFGTAKGEYPVSGKIVDVNNNPISGAAVKLHEIGNPASLLGTATSGADGSYTISPSQLSGKYGVSAEKASYQNGQSTIIVPAAAVTNADVKLTASGQGSVQHTFYASANGSGSACSLSAPCSLTGARDKARTVNGSMTGDIVINLLGGTYTLGSTFSLTEADSGNNGHNIIYQAAQGASPIINGAYNVSGWTAVGNGIYKASLASYGSVRPLSLYVNGNPAVRARTPNVGSYNYVKNWDIPGQKVLLNSSEISNWNNFGDVMLVVKKHWNESKLRLSSYTVSGSVASVTVKSPEQANNFGLSWPNMETASDYQQNYFFENAMEFLDAPGEFYINNSTNELFYMPREGESMASAWVQAPNLQTVMRLQGSSLNNPIHNVQFQGIRFEGSTYTGPSNNGYVGIQAGHSVELNMLPGGVELKNAESIRFERNTFQKMSASGLSLVSGTHNNSIIGNVFKNIGGNGIQVGASISQSPADYRENSKNDTVQNNYITSIGQYYTGGVGIFAGYVDSMTIEHNEVAYNPYTGISIGWGWTNQDTGLKNNRIRYNNVHHNLQHQDDGAGIYTLSKAPGTLIDENYIHDNIKGSYHEPRACDFGTPIPACYPIAGIYMDQESSGMSVNNNVIVNVPNKINLGNGVPALPNTFSNNDGTSATTISNSGIESAYQDIKSGNAPTELAQGKTATASTSNPGYGPGTAVDGNNSTGWAPAGTTGTPNHWWQVDLGASRTIKQVNVVTRQDVDQPSTRKNFEVRASNDPNFGTYAVMATQSSSVLPYKSTWITPVYNNASDYRYIRIVKTYNEYFFISELQVFGY
ncbi:discoidin domain-containing protein [Paenibacillus nasutitermitis]|uniref:F5/8 type C domain-containing protein n=1 Tax=Paenibacillus nasutitermitis TaxID=1652958 RepID=A0A916ZF01_9BACL|nr:discoidin domain-containing protein [Paenibacillus nasutitermitis]GGD93785.1 hypothetical protein GCM10010911_60550 [Paenibacillus nasutitermitis]